MHTQSSSTERVCNMHDNATGPMNKMMCPCAMSFLLALVSASRHTQANSVVEEREDIPAGRRLAAARLKTLCWRCRWLKQLQDKVLRRRRAELFMIRHSLASKFSLGDSKRSKTHTSVLFRCLEVLVLDSSSNYHGNHSQVRVMMIVLYL